MPNTTEVVLKKVTPQFHDIFQIHTYWIACPIYESIGLNCHFDRNFMGNLLYYFIPSKSFQLIATSNNAMAYFIRCLIYLFLNVCCCKLSCAAQPGLYWIESKVRYPTFKCSLSVFCLALFSTTVC